MFCLTTLVALATVGSAATTTIGHAVAPVNTRYCGCLTAKIASDPKAFDDFEDCVSDSSKCTEAFNVTDTVTHHLGDDAVSSNKLTLNNFHTDLSSIDSIEFSADGAATAATAVIPIGSRTVKLDMQFQIKDKRITLTPRATSQANVDGTLIEITTVGAKPVVTDPAVVVYGLHKHETSGAAFSVGSAAFLAGAAIYAAL